MVNERKSKGRFVRYNIKDCDFRWQTFRFDFIAKQSKGTEHSEKYRQV